MKKMLFATLMALILVGSVSAQAPTGGVIDQTTVTVENLRVTVNATGDIEPLRLVPLSFGLLGTVSEILVSEGDVVRAGDVLARLDARDLELGVQNAQIALQQQQVRFDQLTGPARDVDVAVAEAAVAAAQASANAAYAAAPSAADLEIARLQAELARNQLWQAQIQRDQTLARAPEFRESDTNDAESQETLLDASLEQADLGISIAETNYAGIANDGADISRLSQANASIVQASIQLDNLLNGPDENDLRLAEIALENSALAVERAQLQLEDMILVAPFDGIVTANNLVVGELPPANGAAIELADMGALVVNLLIDETDVVQLEVGQSVDFELDALPGTEIAGTLEHISFTPVPGSPVTVYEARVVVAPTDEPVRLGMSTTASIIVAEIPDALVVPNRFIRLDRTTQQATVTIMDANNRIRTVAVTLGERNDTQSQVLSGLEAGQEIVLVDEVRLPAALGGSN